MRQRIACVLVFLFVVGMAVRGQDDQINLLLTKLPAGKDPQRYKGYVPPQFKEFAPRNFYLPMRDGVKIAIQVVLPKDLPADQKLPAVLVMTRYWRARQGDGPGTFMPSHGYATVFVDARGTGASFGVWKAPFSQDEVKDYNQVVNWIVTQPWSNGKVGALGNSYTGNTALWLASTIHPAVKAVIPRHYEFDLYAETAYPGGILTDWTVKTWNEGNRQLDTNPGVKLVDEDADRKLYNEAMKRRAENIDVYAAALRTTFRDDRSFGYTLDELSLHTDAAAAPQRFEWTVAPGKFAEINVELGDGAKMSASFESDAPVGWNVHSHPGNEPTIHAEGKDAKGAPAFTAEKGGLYSYLWVNKGKQAVKLVVELTIEGTGRVHSTHPE